MAKFEGQERRMPKIEACLAEYGWKTLEDADALKILQKLAKQGHESAQTFISNNRQDLADEELAQARVIEEYLPKPLTDEEIESEVKAVIAETGAQGMKDMGRVMGIASKKMAGRADGRAISAIVKRLLA